MTDAEIVTWAPGVGERDTPGPYPPSITVRRGGADIEIQVRATDVDVRHFPAMPLNVTALFSSAFYMSAEDRVFKAGLTLWGRSWHQVPAGSVPDDDRQLSHLAGFGSDVRAWKRIREVALHGFLKASDGRFYHPVVCLYALEAFASSRRQSMNAKIGVQKRQGPEKTQNTSGHGSSGGTARDVAGRSHGSSRGGARIGSDRIGEDVGNKKPSSGNGSGKPSPGSGKGTRISEDFQPDVDVLSWAAGKNFSAERVEELRLEFIDYWKGVPGSRGLKLDWQATFRNRLRDKGAERPPRSNGREHPGGGFSLEAEERKKTAWRGKLKIFVERGQWPEGAYLTPPPTDPQCGIWFEYPEIAAEFGFRRNPDGSVSRDK